MGWETRVICLYCNCNCNWHAHSSFNNNIVNNLLFNYCNLNLITARNKITFGIADSGCSDHYAASNAKVCNITPTTNIITAALPNGNTIILSHKAELKLSNIPAQVQSYHIFPTMRDKVLISLGKLCNNSIEAYLNKKRNNYHWKRKQTRGNERQ